MHNPSSKTEVFMDRTYRKMKKEKTIARRYKSCNRNQIVKVGNLQ